MKVESESEVAQLYLTLCDPMDCSLPGSSVHGIFQAGVLEWGAIALRTNAREYPNSKKKKKARDEHMPFASTEKSKPMLKA